MKKLILIACLIVHLICTGQIDFVKQADLLLSARRIEANNEPKKALHFYETAFKIDEARTIAEYLKAAVCAAKLENEASCKKWIIESIKKKKATLKFLLKFSDNVFYQKCLGTILPDYDNYLSVFYESLENPMVYFQIQELINRDQETRSIKSYYLGITEKDKEIAFKNLLAAQASKDTLAINKYEAIVFPKIDKALQDYSLKAMRYADSLNIVKLIDITKKYGWQKEGWTILWHQRGTFGEKNWVWDFFKPYINNEIEKGTITPFFWVLFEDINSIFKTGKSIYGYHPGLVDANSVNINRRKIGLPELTNEEIEKRNSRRDGGGVF